MRGEGFRLDPYKSGGEGSGVRSDLIQKEGGGGGERGKGEEPYNLI